MSCKWAGGGLVSNAEDIAQLGDILLYLLQNREDSGDRYLSVESIGNMTAYNAGSFICRLSCYFHSGLISNLFNF